jgi:inosine-uridine nucleoside N-ribohydrolase
VPEGQKMRPFIIDCDTGRDDALTLWLAVNAGLPLAAVIASYGNTSLARVADNTAKVLSLAGRDDVPFLAGLEKPQRDHRLFEPVVVKRQKDSGNGLCNLEFPPSARGVVSPSMPGEMAEFLRKLAKEYGVLDYFIIGPASNFAAIAKALGGDLNNVVACITMMGGKFDPLWTEMSCPDFNMASDPYAVGEIMGLGMCMRFLPLNATWPICMTLAEIEELFPTTPLAKWAQALMIAHCLHFDRKHVFRFHDPSILLAAQMPERFSDKRLRLVLDENAEDFGRLIEDPAGFDCQVYQTDKATQDLFKKAISSWLAFA